MSWVYDDGGRKDAGRRASRDCVVRAIAIALERPYMEVYEELASLCKESRTKGGRSHPRRGISTPVIRSYLAEAGWHWLPTIGIGTGCVVHLDPEELPGGTLIVSLSHHICCVKDGVIHDTYNPARSGKRCVYGIWSKHISSPYEFWLAQKMKKGA